MAAGSAPLGDAALADRAQALVGRAGGSRVIAIGRITGGRNNRAYRVDTAERAFFLKAYHSDPDDPRSRRRAEWAFLRFAWEAGIRCVPEPIAEDEECNLGLYSFVTGHRLDASEVGPRHIEQAARFIDALNRGRRTAAATALPVASEACFTIEHHLDLIEARVRRLEAIDGSGDAADAARALVHDRLLPLWLTLSSRAREVAAASGLLDSGELPAAERCLSPSDFGFHNAIVLPTGQLMFHDFEYAGWDDPAKMVCDFLCQPEVAVPDALTQTARENLARAVLAPETQQQRIDLLLPLYRVKWTCICLNEFVPTAARRRRFAAELGDAQKAAQVVKAEQLLDAAGPL